MLIVTYAVLYLSEIISLVAEVPRWYQRVGWNVAFIDLILYILESSIGAIITLIFLGCFAASSIAIWTVCVKTHMPAVGLAFVGFAVLLSVTYGFLGMHILSKEDEVSGPAIVTAKTFVIQAYWTGGVFTIWAICGKTDISRAKKIGTSVAMGFGLIICFCFVFAYVLAPLKSGSQQGKGKAKETDNKRSASDSPTTWEGEPSGWSAFAGGPSNRRGATTRSLSRTSIFE